MLIIKNMEKLRLTRITLITLASMMFLWTFSIAIHDLIDPKVNLGFMTKVLAGGTPASSLAIKNEVAIKLIYNFMLVFESGIAITFLFATIKTYYSLKSEHFSKNALVLGLLLCLLKYFLGFVVIASEWFYMWQTSGATQVKALLISVLLLITLMMTLFSD